MIGNGLLDLDSDDEELFARLGFCDPSLWAERNVTSSKLTSPKYSLTHLISCRIAVGIDKAATGWTFKEIYKGVITHVQEPLVISFQLSEDSENGIHGSFNMLSVIDLMGKGHAIHIFDEKDGIDMCCMPADSSWAPSSSWSVRAVATDFCRCQPRFIHFLIGP